MRLTDKIITVAGVCIVWFLMIPLCIIAYFVGPSVQKALDDCSADEFNQKEFYHDN